MGIVIHEDKVLLMRRKVNGDEYYVFPGGGVDPGETIEEAVEREIEEEASLKIKAEKLIYRLTDEFSEHYFYLCSYISGEPELGEGNERDDMHEENIYCPEWRLVTELPHLTVYQLEVRDWLIEDLKNGFGASPRELTSLTSERRKV